MVSCNNICVFPCVFISQTVVIPHSRTFYIRAGDVPAIHYMAGSDGIILDEQLTKRISSGIPVEASLPEYVQDSNWSQGHLIRFIYNNDRRETHVKISLDCITG